MDALFVFIDQLGPVYTELTLNPEVVYVDRGRGKNQMLLQAYYLTRKLIPQRTRTYAIQQPSDMYLEVTRGLSGSDWLEFHTRLHTIAGLTTWICCSLMVRKP